MFVSVGDVVAFLHFLLRLLDHHATEGGDALRDLQTGQLADRRAREAVHRVGADLAASRQASRQRHGYHGSVTAASRQASPSHGRHESGEAGQIQRRALLNLVFT